MSEAAKAMPVATNPSRRLEQVRVFGSLSTRSPKMRASLVSLEQLAESDVSLVIEGETGVGKEVAAESVHRASLRRRGPFLVFDCAAKSLAAGERELFGSEEESLSFTEAMPGILELAFGGTILLDHVDELAVPLQLRLVRALERRQIKRVGGTQSIDLDLRVIAACTRSLRREVRLGAFKRELFEQVCAECVRIPPLRQRLEDLMPLAQEFLAAFQPPRTLQDIPEHVWEAFRAYQWPGNVRELKNALQRAVVVPDRALRFTRGT